MSNIKIVVVFFRVLYSRFPNPGGVLGTWIHMLNLGVGRPTHLSTKSFSNPSLYQFFFLKSIKVPIFALKPIHLPKFWPQNQTRCKILLWNPSINQNLTLKPIHLPKFHNFLGKMTHPSIYISLSNPIFLHWPYVSMKICEYPPLPGFPTTSLTTLYYKTLVIFGFKVTKYL